MKPILFTEAELETIERAMDDYVSYADPDTPASDLIGDYPLWIVLIPYLKKSLLPIATYEEYTPRTPRGHHSYR